MLAIEMAGGVYCPLSPRDPQHRLQSLLKQAHGRFVLVHYLTKTKFENHIISFDTDLILTESNPESDFNVNRLSNVIVTSENIGYIIFTSGSTGVPKAVSTQRNQFFR
jgi:non-ribosomal peptide synthetase component F